MFKSYIEEGWNGDDIDAFLKYFATEFTLLSPNNPMLRRTGKHIKHNNVVIFKW